MVQALDQKDQKHVPVIRVPLNQTVRTPFKVRLPRARWVNLEERLAQNAETGDGGKDGDRRERQGERGAWHRRVGGNGEGADERKFGGGGGDGDGGRGSDISVNDGDGGGGVGGMARKRRLIDEKFVQRNIHTNATTATTAAKTTAKASSAGAMPAAGGTASSDGTASSTGSAAQRGAGLKVIVLGAGAAGLSAAKTLELVLPGAKVKIIEARSRIGGRILSAQLPNDPHMEPGGAVSGGTFACDLGASYVHGCNETNPLWRLARASNRKLDTTDGGYSSGGSWVREFGAPPPPSPTRESAIPYAVAAAARPPAASAHHPVATILPSSHLPTTSTPRLLDLSPARPTAWGSSCVWRDTETGEKLPPPLVRRAFEVAWKMKKLVEDSEVCGAGVGARVRMRLRVRARVRAGMGINSVHDLTSCSHASSFPCAPTRTSHLSQPSHPIV